MAGGNDWFLIVWAVVCVIVVLAMTYWVTRFVAGKGLLRGSFGQGGNGQIKIVEQRVLGRDQKLLIVQVNEKYYLLGMTANNISLLSEVDWAPQTGQGDIAADQIEKPAFHEAFFDVLKQKTRR